MPIKMPIKKQLLKLKENWLLIVLVLVVLLMLNYPEVSLTRSFAGPQYAKAAYETAGIAEGFIAPYIPPSPSQDFAPGVVERKITKTASLSTEVERGKFNEADSKLKSIVKSSDLFLINENVNKIGRGSSSYFAGSYSLRVESSKYDLVISQLRGIGEVLSFNENT